MTLAFEPIPPSQLFRALLLHMLETHRILTPYVRHTTSHALKSCQTQNAYILSEIASWLEDQIEDLDLTPSFSSAQLAELRDGVVSSLETLPRPLDTTASPPSAQPAPTGPRPGIRREASSRRVARTRPALQRNSSGQIVFPAR